MATSKMKITVEAEVAKANAELQKINQTIDKMKTSQEKANNVFDNFMKGGKIAIVATTVVKSIQKVVDVSKEMIDLYKQQVLAETKLEGSLIASGNAIGYNVGELKQMASQFQSVTTFGDEVVMSAQGMMLAYQNVGKNVFPEAIKASMDLSTALGKDLNSATQQLGKALNNPIEGMSSLKEIGISFTKDKQALITKLTNENKLYEAQRILLDEVNSRYGGMAEKVGALDVSKLDKIKNLTGDIGENFGSILLHNLAPTFGWIEEKMETLAAATRTHANRLTGNFKDFTDEGLEKELENTKKAIEDAEIAYEKSLKRASQYAIVTPSANIATNKAYLQKIEAEIQLREELAKVPPPKPIDLPTGSGIGTSGDDKEEEDDTWISTTEKVLKLAKETNIVKLKNLELEDKAILALKEKVLVYKAQLEEGIVLDVNDEEITSALQALQDQLDINAKSRIEITGENDALIEAQEYLKSNAGLLDNVYEIKVANLEAEIATAEAMLTTIGLSKEEKEHLETIIRLKKEQLDDEVSGNSEIAKFLEINKQFIQDNVVSREEELQKTRATAMAQLATADATEAQKKQLEAIIKGIDLEVAGLKEVKSWADKMEDAISTVKPDGWDDWFDNLEGAISKVEDIFSGMFNSISGYLSSSFDVFENETKIKLQSLEKQLDKMVKENDKARKKIDDNESDSMKALQEQYDADAISYADYQARKGEIEEEAKLARDALAEAEQQKKDEMLALENELNRKKFEADKRNNIATAIMNGATAAIRAFADLGPIFGGVMAATIAGITAAQVANISSQSFIPALKEGGVALSPTLAQVGDGDEPELVLPLSKAKDFGFGAKQQQPTQIINVTVENNTIYGIDDFGKKAYDAIKSAQKIGKVPKKPF